MKNNIQLGIGIIIGVLIVACTGSDSPTESASPLTLKEQQAQFESINLRFVTTFKGNDEIKLMKEQGWTILDFENVEARGHYFLVGK